MTRYQITKNNSLSHKITEEMKEVLFAFLNLEEGETLEIKILK
jgi:hypothetical protein